MGIILYILFVFVLLFSHKNKALFWLSFIYLWIVYFACTKTFDIQIYIDRYDMYDGWFANFTEPLYTASMECFHFCNMKFEHVQMFISFLFLISLYFFINKTTKNKGVVIAFILISIYSFLVDVQRSCYAFSIVLVAFYVFLYGKKTWKSRFVFIALICFACLIHMMSVIFLLFILVDFVHERKLNKYVFVTLIIGILSVGAIYKLVPELMNIIDMADKGDIFMGNTENTSNKFKQYSFAFLRCSSVVIIPIGIKFIMKKQGKDNLLNQYDKKTINTNILSIVLFPFLYINHDMFRIWFIIAIMNYCMASRFLYIKYVFLFTFLCSLNVAYWFMWRPYFKEMFWDVYMNNYIIK